MGETLVMWECEFEPTDTLRTLFDEIEGWCVTKGPIMQVASMTIIWDFKDDKYAGYARYYKPLKKTGG